MQRILRRVRFEGPVLRLCLPSPGLEVGMLEAACCSCFWCCCCHVGRNSTEADQIQLLVARRWIARKSEVPKLSWYLCHACAGKGMHRVHHERGPGAEAVSDCLADRSTSSLFSMTGSNNCELILPYLRYPQRGHPRGIVRQLCSLKPGLYCC